MISAVKRLYSCGVAFSSKALIWSMKTLGNIELLLQVKEGSKIVCSINKHSALHLGNCLAIEASHALLMAKYHNPGMARLYLLGGESVYRRNAKEVNERAFEDAGPVPNVSVFPWARPSFDKKYGRRQLLTDYLRSLGACKVDFIEYGEFKEVVAEKVEHSALVYLTGGQPSILIERLKKSGVDELLKTFRGVVVGRSAGALALCSKCIVTCRSNGKVRIVEGLGLVDITLKVHYIPENEEILKRFSMKETIFAVPQGAALVYDHGKLSAIGKVYIFANGVRQVFSETFYEKNLPT